MGFITVMAHIIFGKVTQAPVSHILSSLSKKNCVKTRVYAYIPAAITIMYQAGPITLDKHFLPVSTVLFRVTSFNGHQKLCIF